MNRPELREGDVLTRRYLLQERIATGGMSVIWRAFDQALQRKVAIKVLHGSLDEDHPGRELIRREARATAQLIHPDAIEVYDYGETVTRGGIAAYVVMRLLEGRSLADRLAEGPLPWTEAVAIAAGLAEVLASAHDKGIVHRDVTPENVLLAADGPKLIDFGIAAFIGESDDHLVADFGTPPYVAPERLKDAPADPAVDVYALGVLLFEMLTGTLPYPEKTWEAIEAARRDGPPPVPEGVPGLPREVAELCRSCLSADPARRPTARALASALSAIGQRAQRPEPRGASWGAVAAATLAFGGALLFYQAGGVGSGLAESRYGPAPTPIVSVLQESAPAQSEQHKMEPVTNTEQTSGPLDQAAPAPRRERGRDSADEPRRQASPAPTVKPLPLATTAPPIALDDAVRRFDLLVDGAEATGDLAPDVALDLKQVLHNSVADGMGLDRVRSKIFVRYREGRLSPVLKLELETVLQRVEAVLTRAAGA